MRPGSPLPPPTGPYHELERAYRKEVAGHKETKETVTAARVTAVVLVGCVLLWWFVLR